MNNTIKTLVAPKLYFDEIVSEKMFHILFYWIYFEGILKIFNSVK